MSSTNQVLPHIINALSLSTNHQENLDNLVRTIENDFKASNQSIKSLSQDVRRSLQVGLDFGLLAVNNDNVFRLKFNPNAKPPFGVIPIQGNNDSLTGVGSAKNNDPNDEPAEESTQRDATDSYSQKSADDDDDDDDDWDDEEKEDMGLKKNECPISFCMKKFKMNARARRMRNRRGGRSRSRSRKRRSSPRRRRRRTR